MIELDEKPKSPIIIEGFPGFGFVSTIATEFLIKHLNAKRIGRIFTKSLTPMAAIHKSEVVDPLEIYYDKKYNVVILRALTNISGAEWEIADIIMDLAKELKAKEIISLEGISGENNGKSKVYYFSNVENKKFKDIDVEILKEGIVIGVTGVLLMKAKKIRHSCIFAEASPNLPDSRAAGEIIKILDEYLGLKVNYAPLVKSAEDFEKKLKDLLSQAQKATEQKQKKEVSYLG